MKRCLKFALIKNHTTIFNQLPRSNYHMVIYKLIQNNLEFFLIRLLINTQLIEKNNYSLNPLKGDEL